jgi:glycosyltransferase involved in cell wall biosynthesis
MRVLVVTNMFPTTAKPWFGSFVRDQVDDLRRLGFSVEVYSFDGRTRRREYARAAGQLRYLTRGGRFDLIHAHYGLTGAVAVLQTASPVVTTFHGSDTGYIRWQRVVSALVARRSVPIFVSSRGADRLHCVHGHVIPVGVDTDLFVPRERTELRRRLGWDESARYVLFPGARRNRVKRADLFERTVALLRMAGEHVEPAYLENLSREEAALVVAASDVMLMTSDSEGSPLAIRESLACMTPVVSVPVGDVEDTLADLPSCAVAARDPKGLAAAVSHAMRSPRDSVLRERALATSRLRIAARIAAVYQEVVAS